MGIPNSARMLYSSSHLWLSTICPLEEFYSSLCYIILTYLIASQYSNPRTYICRQVHFCSNKYTSCRKPVCSPGAVVRSTHVFHFEFGRCAPAESISRIYYWCGYLVVTPGWQSKLRIYISIPRDNNYHADLKQGTASRVQVKKCD